jgi:flagellar biosynthesis protein FlhB
MRDEEFIKRTVGLLPYNLQFFADDGDKTEDATAKKLGDARGEGQVARSKELITASSLTTLFLVLKIFVGYFGTQFINSFKLFYGCIEKLTNEDFSILSAESLLSEAFMTIIITCLPVFIITIIVTIVVLLFQVKWRISGKIIQPKFSKINPIKGFKQMLSKDKLVELFVDILKITIICYIAYSTLKNQWGMLFVLYDLDLEVAIILIGNIIITLGLKISLIFLLIGAADLIYQKLKFKKDMRMSKQEVKDEYKNSEGDPQIKSKIRAKMREVSMKRMMQSLPKADVIITNPTHLAAAIMYDKQSSTAPILVAKGADFLAQKIKEVAKEHNIEIIENKPLARMLYYNVEIGDEIPPELYQMTAEILAYVYGLKNKVS